MKAGLFIQPTHPPERRLYDGQQWDLEVLRWADELGYSEAWIGEHFTTPWEPNPSPDLTIAQALLQTKQIKLAPGAHLLPFHHPAELACRVAFMDHLAQGRYMLGIGAGAIPGDFELFNVDGMGGENRHIMAEALDIMLRIWESDGGLDYKGQYWTVHVPEPNPPTIRHHLKPFQKPHPPIGIAGFSPSSDSLKLAGERGFYPLSLCLSTRVSATHWAAIEEGARLGGRTPNRADWRVVREVFVADTDAEAERWCLQGNMGRMMREYFLPLFDSFQMLNVWKEDESLPDADVTPEWLVHHGWLVGSVETVTEKLEKMYEDLGGFGTLLMLTFDYADNPGPWKYSMELLAKQVLPKLAHLAPQPVASG
jgi:alkanesulfonate monooxygenase SsuD/methylene tetrahydromethanopterin reductase-like flavin-dependent oxidoreductase (luciferase family)